MKILINLLYFIKNMIYFSKLIDICINCQESQKVVDNYFVATRISIAKSYALIICEGGARKGAYRSFSPVKAGTKQGKIVLRTILRRGLEGSPTIGTNDVSVRTFYRT